jgi:hydroxypyruvate isomerase
MENSSSRRNMIRNLVGGVAAASAGSLITSFDTPDQKFPLNLKNNIKHSVCRWCYQSIPLEEFCAGVKAMGLEAVDLVGPKDWPTLKKYGLYSSMCNGAEISIPDGWNEMKNHETLIRNYSEMIPLAAKAGYKQIICFSGNKRGVADEITWKNCADGLQKIMPLAEKHKISIVMELLNSKVDHGDYNCDKSVWGIELVKKVGSENFRLLYDIYHMQIDEGDVIRTIKDNHQYFAHYHTGGVPGRHEIDESQELFYPAIVKAIIDTGFDGYLAQEFIPTKKDSQGQLAALKNAVKICDV